MISSHPRAPGQAAIFSLIKDSAPVKDVFSIKRIAVSQISGHFFRSPHYQIQTKTPIQEEFFQLPAHLPVCGRGIVHYQQIQVAADLSFAPDLGPEQNDLTGIDGLDNAPTNIVDHRRGYLRHL